LAYVISPLKGLPGTNTLAYLPCSSVTEKKKFYEIVSSMRKIMRRVSKSNETEIHIFLETKAKVEIYVFPLKSGGADILQTIDHL
jgi:hypothetical protein